MRDFIEKIDNDNGAAGVVVADEYNSLFEEVKNVVKSFFDPTESDSKQMLKSISAISKSLFYKDVGSVNSLVLTSPKLGQDVDSLFEGSTFLFSPKHKNTASSTIKISNNPTRLVVDGGGSELTGGELKPDLVYLAIYKGDKFYISKIPSIISEDLLTPTSFGAEDNSLMALLKSTANIPIGAKISSSDGGLVEAVSSDFTISTKSGVGIEKDSAKNISVTVGDSGDFKTINEAIYYLDGMNRTQGKSSKAEVTLLSGFVMSEQVIVDAKNLGWITIKSVDPIVDVSITEGVSMVPTDDVKPIFGGVNGATLPIIGVLFDFVNNETAIDGVAVYFSSESKILPQCGIRNCRRGIQAYHGSKVFCGIDGLRSSGGSATAKKGVVFNNCKGRALDVQQGSEVSLPRSNFNNCSGDTAVYLIWGSNGNIYQSEIKNATGTAVLARDGSVLNMRECDVSDAGNRAIHALHGSLINARAKLSSGYGVGGARNCKGTIAVLANGASIIEAPELDVSGSYGRGFSADGGSTINAQLATADNCVEGGFYAENASTINANNSSANNCKLGYVALNSSRISAVQSSANNCVFGANAGYSSVLTAQDSTFDDCQRAVQASSASIITIRDTSCRRSAERALSILGARAHVEGVVTTDAQGFHMTVREGSQVSARGFAGAIDLRDGGGMVHNELGTGTLSQTANQITPNGIVFR